MRRYWFENNVIPSFPNLFKHQGSRSLSVFSSEEPDGEEGRAGATGGASCAPGTGADAGGVTGVGLGAAALSVVVLDLLVSAFFEALLATDFFVVFI